MSEKEEKNGASADGTSMVTMEKSAGSRHKQPYRPTELQEPAPNSHHKRSRAPAVTSTITAVAEELKNLSEDSNTSDVDGKKQKESDQVISSEKLKNRVAKKFSSSTKRRESSPEAITLATVNIENKKTVVAPQPIPSEVISGASSAAMASRTAKEAEKANEAGKSDDDSITEDIAELRTSDAVARHSEWVNENQSSVKDVKVGGREIKEIAAQIDLHVRTQPDVKGKVAVNDMATSSSNITRNKEVSWINSEYLSKVGLKEVGDRSRVLLERKASLGPYRTRTSTSGASGILISIPKKTAKNFQGDDIDPMQPGISLSKKTKSCIVNQRPTKESAHETRAIKVDPHIPYLKYITAIRGKCNIARNKIKDVLNV